MKPGVIISKEADKDRARSAILGALVADAASLGLHWLYDQPRIREVAPNAPEFWTPTPADYEGVRGFYAHGRKRVGEFSHYGEQAMVLLRSLVANEGRYDKMHYEELFREYFGYGGDYVGYIDHPTRDTLDNIAFAEHEALRRAEAIPFHSDENTKHRMITKVLSNVKVAMGEELRKVVEGAVRLTHDDDNMVAYACKVVDELESVSGYHGANDEQMPAISKLPALVAAYAGDVRLSEVVESAVRVTNDNNRAVAFGGVAARIMKAAIDGEDPVAAIAAGRKAAEPEVAKLIDEALSLRGRDTTSVTSKFGMSCNLVFGVPSVTHNLATAKSYREAIRQNIYAGGDSCGRAILLGAVLGAAYGVGGESGIPEPWIEKLTKIHEIRNLLRSPYAPITVHGESRQPGGQRLR